MGKSKIYKKIEREGEIILIREKIREEKKVRDIVEDPFKIVWDKVAEDYGIMELVKNLKL